MRKTIPLILVASFVWVSGTVKAEQPRQPYVLSLTEAIRIANEKNIDVIVSKERVNQAIARLGQSASELLPHITGTLSWNRKTQNLAPLLGINNTPGGGSSLVGPFNAFDARISVTQTLFDMSAIQRLRAARFGDKMSRATEVKVRQDVMALVGTLYLDAKRARETIRRADAVLKSDIKKFKILKKQHQIGLASVLEVMEAHSRMTSSRHIFQQAKADEIDKRLDLVTALEISPDVELDYAEDELFPEMQMPSRQEVKDASEVHPEVESARQLTKQRKAEKLAAVSDFLPTVKGTADYGASGDEPRTSLQTYSFGGKVSWPLIDGTHNIFKLRETKSLLRESEAQLADTRLRLEAESLAAIEVIKQSEVFVQAAKKDFAVWKKQLALAELRVDNGSGSELELVAANASYAVAQDDLQEAIAIYRTAEINLAHSMGHMDWLLPMLEIPNEKTH